MDTIKLSDNKNNEVKRKIRQQLDALSLEDQSLILQQLDAEVRHAQRMHYLKETQAIVAQWPKWMHGDFSELSSAEANDMSRSYEP